MLIQELIKQYQQQIIYADCLYDLNKALASIEMCEWLLSMNIIIAEDSFIQRLIR